MFSMITCVVIFITSFSTTKKPTKNRKKNRTELWQHYSKLSSSSTSSLTFIKPRLPNKLNSFNHPQPLLTSVSILFDFNNISDSDVELRHRFNVNSDLRQSNSISRYNLNLSYYWLSCTSLHHSPFLINYRPFVN